MNTTLACLGFTLPIVLVTAGLTAACTTQKQLHPPDKEAATFPVYDTAQQILAMPPCTAAVVEKGPCYAQLRLADGSGCYIGSPGAGPDVMQFVQWLEAGKQYRLPAAFKESHQ